MPIRTAKTYFYPRSPCGERPIKRERGYYSYTFLSTLSLRRATRAWPNIGPAKWISIHALLAESDLTVKVGRSNRNISIHALLAESDANANFMVERVSYFYPRSPCGERRSYFRPYRECVSISIHALLAESDAISGTNLLYSDYFYPRSPCGERHTGQPVRGLPSYFYPRSPCGERLFAT